MLVKKLARDGKVSTDKFCVFLFSTGRASLASSAGVNLFKKTCKQVLVQILHHCLGWHYYLINGMYNSIICYIQELLPHH
jgi:hypothetical protein